MVEEEGMKSNVLDKGKQEEDGDKEATIHIKWMQLIFVCYKQVTSLSCQYLQSALALITQWLRQHANSRHVIIFIGMELRWLQGTYKTA